MRVRQASSLRRFGNEPVGFRQLRWWRGSALVGLLSLLAASCIYDADHPCGPNQHEGANSSCMCDDGLVLEGQVCVPCPKGEVWQTGVCLCKDGYTRSSQGGACVRGGPGVGCDLNAAGDSCADASFAICRDHGEGLGYCTTTCAADADCPRGFSCDTSATPATCKTAALGEGDDCQDESDCAGKDAGYCESAIVHKCLVSGCSTENPLSCSEAWFCCDVRSLGLNLTLCVPEGLCPTAP